MKRVGLLYREKIVKDISNKFSQSNACIFIGFNKLKSISVSTLRNDLRKISVQMIISKNSLIKKALTDLGVSDFESFINESTGLVLVPDDDIVKAAKALADFSKETEGAFIVKGGYLKEKKLSEGDIIDLAKLPSREILLSMAVSGLASPLTGFLAAMNQIVLKFVWLVEEIKKKKQ
jgi:large subunit ribosomal protein L10